MPLDNAQFIAEFDTASPAGTDPINQGDDHLRQIKIATQQSFPNVGSAVPQTGAQMAQMAIKNEVNTFTQTQTFTAGAAAGDSILSIGKVGLEAPGDTSSARLAFRDAGGIERWRFEKAPLSVGGELRVQRFDAFGVSQDTPFSIDAAQGRATFNGIAFFNAEVRAFAGSAAFPAFTFQGNETTGMYNSASNVLNFSTAGADRIALTASEMNIKSSQVWMGDGTAAAPSYSFVGSQNMGIFRQYATSMGFAVGGTQAFAMLVNQLRSISNGSAATPAYSFNSGSGDMGMYRLTGDQLAFVVQQVTRFIIKGNTFTMVNLPTGPGGLLVTGDLYAKQSQLFAGTELVMGVQP